MTIEQATEADLEQCLVAAREFHEVFDPVVEFSPSAFLHYWRWVLGSDTGIMLLAKENGVVVGGVGGVLTKFQTSELLNFVEMFYWVSETHRGTLPLKLIRKAEKEAKKRGAKRMVMACMENSMPDRVERLYLSLGYRPMERHFMKEVL